MYMLDTNTVSYFFKRIPSIVKKFEFVPLDTLCISSVTAAELLYGIEKHNKPKIAEIVHYFLDSLTIYDWDYAAAEQYAQIRAKMEVSGKIMGTLDQMIAAHALSLEDCILVSSDNAFKMVPELMLENWFEQ